MRFQRLIDDIKSGNSDILSVVYMKYRNDFFSFIRKSNNFTKEQVEDAFIDAILILRLNILSDRIQIQNSSVKTYLFAVGRNLLMEEFRRETKLIELQSDGAYGNLLHETESTDGELTNIKRIQEVFDQLSPGCRRMLTHIYFHGWSYQDIQEEYQYQSIEALRVQRVRCIKQLKRIFYGKPQEE